MASPLLLIGCGKMGGAMLDGWLDGGMGDAGVQVVEPFAEATKRFASDARVTLQASVDDVPADFAPGVVVLAVKPQTMDDALASLSRFVKPGTVFLSIAAGKNISYFESHLGSHAAIVRAMPNTPAAVGRGITAITPNANVSAEQGDVCHKLLESVGEVVAVDREELMDQITALSGGGPAYVFLLIEVMAAAGVKAGLPEELSMQLAKATVAGSGELARQSDDPPSQLRINVTSPGGTTAEALRVLMADDGIQPAFDRAIEAATQRSRELSS